MRCAPDGTGVSRIPPTSRTSATEEPPALLRPLSQPWRRGGRCLAMPLDLPGHLERMLTRLKLTAIRDQLNSLDSLIDETGQLELTIREALTLVCEREIVCKDQRRIEMSFGLARFSFTQAPAGFDFAAQPLTDPGQIRELATGRFIANREAVLFPGPPGVGKTHLAVAIDREAIVAGYAVPFAPATTLVARLAKAQAEGRPEESLTLRQAEAADR